MSAPEERLEWLIRKDAYFYRPNKSGYTTSKFEAGRYTQTDAEREARIEPWHMFALHQDEVPDDRAGASVASLELEIDRLSAELARARALLGEFVDRDLSYHGENIVVPCASHGNAIGLVRRARALIDKEPQG